jgi:hypothetical protein
MNTNLLKPDVQRFIYENTGMDITKLALQKNPFPEINFKEILNQIESRTKSKGKLPTWFNKINILFPSKISIEQTSSEKTAAYKTELVSGDSLIDLTGGFGIDTFYFSNKIKSIVHCESNPELSEIVKHNFNQFEKHNIECISGESEKILKKLNKKFDWIYIDPSRRNDIKGKVFLLKDCSPNVPELLENYFKYTNKVLLKTSPILDISAGINELKSVKEIHIVAVENEVKEILWFLEKNHESTIKVICSNLVDETIEKFEYDLPSNSDATFSLPLKFLFEPNASLMKSGGFDEISQQYGIHKLHQNSQLFTSNELKPFCGRVFEIKNQFIYSKENMKLFLANTKANVTTRNFPITVDEIRKKWKIKDGGKIYCFFTTALDNHKIVLLCDKIKKKA